MERWFTDRFGNELYPGLRSRLWRYGAALERIGFKQSNEKPYLFRMPGSVGVVFADLGGTEVIPIWEDDSAYIHGKLECPDWRKRQIIKKVREHCHQADVPTRLSFYEENDPEGLFFAEYDKPDGFCKVCGSQLDGPSLQCDACKPQCAACGDYFPLDQLIQHHVTYEPEELVSVCRSCHLVIHRGKRYQHLRPPATRKQLTDDQAQRH